MEQIAQIHPNIRLIVAEDAQSGIEAINRHQPKLALIDINLPKSSGLDIVNTLKQMTSHQDLQCVAVSAHALKEQINTAMDAGFDGYITKPIDFNVIAKLFNNLDAD
jgi:CheY-like chemotaxis protein